MAPPPFNLMRACFWLLAIAIGVALTILFVAEMGCFWLIIIARTEPLGACSNIGTQAREVWEVMLTTILALLLASRRSPPDDRE